MNSKYEILTDLLTKQIADYIKDGITRLPAERELCNIYNVSRQTVRNALSSLEENNIIRRVPGSGAYITGILPGKYSNKIALLITEDSEYTYPAFISKIEQYLSSFGFSLSVYVTNDDFFKEREYLLNLIDNNVRGIIIEPVNSLISPNIDCYNQLRSKEIPFIFINRVYSNLTDSIVIKEDNHMGGILSGQYLLSLSHTRIAGIFMTNSLEAQERSFGLARSIIESGNSFSNDDLLWYSKEDLISLRKKSNTSFLSDMINRKLKSYSAVVCQNDEIAYHLIRELTALGIDVPSDISVLSFDKSYLSDFSKISITSFGHKDISLSKYLCDTLLSIIKGQPASPSFIQWDINLGQSCCSL